MLRREIVTGRGIAKIPLERNAQRPAPGTRGAPGAGTPGLSSQSWLSRPGGRAARRFRSTVQFAPYLGASTALLAAILTCEGPFLPSSTFAVVSTSAA